MKNLVFRVVDLLKSGFQKQLDSLSLTPENFRLQANFPQKEVCSKPSGSSQASKRKFAIALFQPIS